MLDERPEHRLGGEIVGLVKKLPQLEELRIHVGVPHADERRDGDQPVHLVAAALRDVPFGDQGAGLRPAGGGQLRGENPTGSAVPRDNRRPTA